MNCQPTRLHLERFRAAIVQRTGLHFDDAKLDFLGTVLRRRLDKLGHTNDAYLLDLECQPSAGEIAALARELTVGETYFFRNNEQFRALAEVALPERISTRNTQKTLRLLSAGCASGEEPYSMAIVVREAIADPTWDIQIRAIDLNPIVLEKAAHARYSPWSLRDTPVDMQRKWFYPAGRDWIVHQTARNIVKFDARNLASDDPELWLPATYDAIFCRNVLMYFSPEQMRGVIERIAQSLLPGGFLFLGHAETLRNVTDRFHLCHSHATFYYKLKEGAEGSCRHPASLQARALPSRPVIDLDGAWFDTIRKATDRVAALVPAQPATGSSPLRPQNRDFAPALDLLRRERFAEALEYVRRGLPDIEKDPDALLLEATLLAHDGQLTAAEDACQRLLLVDEFNAAAHYVLALCREQSGNLELAGEHDRVAAHLDPTFAMPRLHLGLLANRAGDRANACRELARALLLLKCEDASRLLLFGGGFGREALMALCESTMCESGGRS